MPPPGTAVGGGPLPAVRDVAVRFDGNPGRDVWLTERGGDAQVWELDAVGSYDAVKHPAIGFARLAVAPDSTLWAVASNGTLWRRIPSGHWLQANTVGTVTAPLDDVTVASDSTIWLTGSDGTLWTTTDGSQLVERTALIPFRRLSAGHGGLLLGISFNGALWRFNGSFWELANNIASYLDVSLTFEGLIWVVRADGVMCTSPDGASVTALPGQGGFENVAAGRYGISWGAKADGNLMIWAPIPAMPPTTPPGTTPPPPTAPAVPVISVSVEGGSFDSVYLVTGHDFKPSSPVSIRVTRLDIMKGGVIDMRFNTRSDAGGDIVERLAIPCFSGEELNFSATDGRPDPSDIFTGVVWSRPVPVVCPF